MVFVSTGRCGTRRLFEILRDYLPPSRFEVRHQLPGSRAANVVGNLLFHFFDSPLVREMMYRWVVGEGRRNRSLIISDPLTAMMLPDSWIRSDDVAVIHVTRDDEGFAQSMFGLSRTRRNSFFAHNLIPFWQPFLFPFQNALDPGVQRIYQRINRKKNRFFHLRCRKNPHYRKIDMKSLFSGGILERTILDFFGVSIAFPETVLSTRSNASFPVPHR